MITSSTALKNIFYNKASVIIKSGCYIEYNMNTMLDGISVTNNISDSLYTSQIVNAADQQVWPASRPNPYKKLFPVDSIVKPFRPENSGIKYFILEKVSNGSGTDVPKNSFSSYRSVSYPESQPRIYYPGASTYYKYWVTPQNTGVDVTVNYLTSGTKFALTNKIVIKFEKTHSLPSSYTIKITKSDNTQETIASSLSTPANGIVNLYYNGTTWSANQLSEPYSFANPVSIKSINITTPSAGTDRIIGLIEISARWVKDISDDVESFDISKEASSSSEDLLPVGKVTSNNISLNLIKYNQTSLQYASYNRSVALNSSLTYMVKNAKLTPYFKIYHADGAITEGLEKYDKIYQGQFYVDEWNIGAYGEVSVNALDSAKYLMEVICPDVLCEFYPATAVIRRLLDSVGYTNYKFNLTSETDSSVPLINYFWTDGSKTVWEYIQEICRDIQMNAIVDENDILQFYSRNYMYGRTTKDWNFYYEAESSILPNIVDFSQKEIASANQVKVIWSTPTSTSYLGTSGPLWQSPTKFLVAGGLLEPLSASGNQYLAIKFETLDKYSKFQSGFNFNGYFLVDSEIIEYDAMGYQYVPKDSNDLTFINIWIENAADLNKYTNFAKPGSENIASDIYIKPNGRYRIKTRGALGTTAAAHNSSGVPSTQYAWTGVLL
jgi:hypothetical protein